MISKEKVYVLAQLIGTMEDALDKLNEAIGNNEIEAIRRIKQFIITIHTKINQTIGGMSR